MTEQQERSDMIVALVDRKSNGDLRLFLRPRLHLKSRNVARSSGTRVFHVQQPTITPADESPCWVGADTVVIGEMTYHRDGTLLTEDN